MSIAHLSSIIRGTVLESVSHSHVLNRTPFDLPLDSHRPFRTPLTSPLIPAPRDPYLRPSLELPTVITVQHSLVCAPLALVYKLLEYPLYSLSKSYSCLCLNSPSAVPQNPSRMLLASMPLGHPKDTPGSNPASPQEP